MFSTLEFHDQWAVERGDEGFGGLRAKEGQLTETWPDWIEIIWLRCEQRGLIARVWRVTSCDAVRTLCLTFAPWCLFEADPGSGISRSGLDYVQTYDESGEPASFYVAARQALVGATYQFHTTGQLLRVRDGGEEINVGARAHVTRLWMPR
jgi:hypothetical protein